jgi:hypothetical protein
MTKRRPAYDGKKFSPAAIEAFKKMEVLRYQCECPDIDWAGKYWDTPGRPCPACEQWTAAHNVLHKELQLGPHQDVYDHPDDENPYPAGCYAAERWQRQRDERPEGVELYHALKYQALKQAAG